jgi:hypothetical protein
MDDLRFHWGALIEAELEPFHLKAVIKVLQMIQTYTSSNGRTRNEAYKFIASRDESTQRDIYEGFRRLLVNPTLESCKSVWLKKRKLEDQEIETRDVKARLDDIKANLRRHGEKASISH